VLKVVKRIAGTRVPVLVRGESGTGKELIARALHDSGRRKDGPFVAVNCAAVPASLLEAELFGVVKGAATGVGARKGRFELAHGGTLLLDEIGDMRPPLQAKLLRVLQEGEVFPVGSQRPVKVNVRIVSASNKNLEAMIRRGQFREDLYYRLNAVELRLPPLRERTGDIPALVDRFLGQIGREYGREKTGVTAEVIERFLSYRWPGNIRQLRHVLEQAVLLTDGPVVTVDDLPAAIRKLRPVMQRRRPGAVRRARLSAEKQAAEAVVRDRLVKCLEQTEGNITRAAKLAGYSRVHFYRLMKKHGIQRPGSRPK
jgi:transcriptional regulator with PAS, ATPase and Fis domain